MEKDLAISYLDFSSNKSEKYYINKVRDLLYQTSNSSLFIYDLSSKKCTYFSPHIWKITGYLPHELIGKGIGHFQTLIHPIDFSKFICDTVSFIQSDQCDENSCKLVKTIWCKLKHKSVGWVQTKISVFSLLSTQKTAPNKLIGYIQKAKNDCNSFSSVKITPREKQVLHLIAGGNSAKIIGLKLNIGENTVITHRKNLKEKLKAKNTAELIQNATHAQLL